MDEDILVIDVEPLENEQSRNPPTNIILNVDPVANQNFSFNPSNHKEAFGNTVTNEKLPTNNGFITFNPQGKTEHKIIIEHKRFLKKYFGIQIKCTK